MTTGMEFYVGLGHPDKAAHTSAPTFISVATLQRYKGRGDRWPFGPAGHYALDSGAYTALTGARQDTPWHDDPDLYGGMITRIVDESGYPPDFVAPQDYPIGPDALAATGLSADLHRELTLMSYLHVAREFYFLPWIPVIQARTVAEALTHADDYLAAGVDLAGAHRVGVGSIAARQTDPEAAAIVQALHARGYRLHGFGVGLAGTARFGQYLASADSQAWSATARREHIMLPGCDHRSRAGDPTDCRSCLRYALHYRDQVLSAAN